MQAVIDSSSLIFAYKVKEILKLLRTRYNGLLLPGEVYTEAVKGGKRLGMKEANLIETEAKKGFLKVKQPRRVIEAEHLGRGELEAISLAYEEGLPLIIDDRKARIPGTCLGMKVIHVSSFILWGVKKGLLAPREAKGILKDLVKAGYWLRGAVYLELIDAIESEKEPG